MSRESNCGDKTHMDKSLKPFSGLERADWRGIMEHPGLTVKEIDAPDIYPGQRKSFAGQIIDALASLPPGRALQITPPDGKTITAVRALLIATASRRNIRIRTSIRGGVLVVLLRGTK